MTRFHAHVATEHASRYLQQLCKHWSHKFEVAFDPQAGKIVFDPATSCTLEADAALLRMQVDAQDGKRGARMCEVVSEHVRRFAFREQLQIEWQAG